MGIREGLLPHACCCCGGCDSGCCTACCTSRATALKSHDMRLDMAGRDARGGWWQGLCVGRAWECGCCCCPSWLWPCGWWWWAVATTGAAGSSGWQCLASG